MLSEEIQSDELEIDLLQSEVATLRERLLAAEEARDRAELLMAQAETKVRDREHKLAERQRQLADRDRVVADKERLLLAADSERRSLKAALDRSTASLTRLRNSVSWRVTLPIRGIARRFGLMSAWAGFAVLKLRKALHTRSSDIRLIKKSGLFDADYYLREYPEVARSGMDPIVHYLEIGAKQGKNPSPYFDTVYYARQMEKRYARAAGVKN